MLLQATYEITNYQYVCIHFSVEVPHFPRACGPRSIDYNNSLLGRATDISTLAVQMAAANQRCFRVECNPSEDVYEQFLRGLVTVDGLEYVTAAGRYFIAITHAVLHPAIPLCVAVVEEVRKHFYPGYDVEMGRHPAPLQCNCGDCSHA